MNARFAGKSVFVAGGTGGLGKAICVMFLEEAAKVHVTYRNGEEFKVLQSLTEQHASRLQGHQVDLIDESAVRQLTQQVVAEHSSIDVLVNAVGAYAGGLKLWETESKTFETMLDLNLRCGYILTKAIVPAMLKRNRGAIVNVASKAAVDHAAGTFAYAASKAAAVAMIDCLAEDLRGTGVRVNSVLPSIIDTPANRRAMPNADFTGWPKPDDIAKVILFLCSDDAGLVHGTSIPL